MLLNYSRSLAEDFAGERPRWGQWEPGSLGTQMAVVLPPREYLATSDDIFGCHNWGATASGIYPVEARGAARHPRLHRPAPQTKELSGPETSLAVQWLRLHASTAGGTGLIPGGRTKVPHAAQCHQEKKRENYLARNINCAETGNPSSKV